MNDRVDLTIVMPAFNERQTIERAVEEVLAAVLPVATRELVVVDDGSTDGTRELLRRFDGRDGVRVELHDRNRGKGAAIRTGLSVARGEIFTVIDADLEYDPAYVAELLEPLLAGRADAVYGVRGFQSHSAYNFWYVIGNKVVTFAANLLYNSWLSDIMTCHKAMRTETFRALPLHSDGFGIEAEITARLLRRGIRIYEVPVMYTARSREAGKKLTAADGMRVLLTLLRCRFETP